MADNLPVNFKRIAKTQGNKISTWQAALAYMYDFQPWILTQVVVMSLSIYLLMDINSKAEKKQQRGIRIVQFSPHYHSPCFKEGLHNINIEHLYDSNPYFVDSERFYPLYDRWHKMWLSEYEERVSEELRMTGYRLRCYPSIYIAGMNKCGTTDLYHSLALHPKVLHGSLKETQWWSLLRFQVKRPGSQIDNKEFLDLFDEAGLEILAGKSDARIIEATPNYLFTHYQYIEQRDREPKRLIANDIHDRTPEAKIFIILNNPVLRVQSYYYYNFYKENTKSENDGTLFDESVDKVISAAVQCVNRIGSDNDYNTRRKCAYTDPYFEGVYHDTKVSLWEGCYSIFIRDWIRVFGNDQVYVLNLKDMSDKKRRGTLTKIFDYLHLEQPDENIMNKMINQRNRMQSTVRDRPMLNETKEKLMQFYSWCNEDLSQLLNDETYLEWNTMA